MVGPDFGCVPAEENSSAPTATGVIPIAAPSAARYFRASPGVTPLQPGQAFNRIAEHIPLALVPLRSTQTRLVKLFLDAALRELVH